MDELALEKGTVASVDGASGTAGMPRPATARRLARTSQASWVVQTVAVAASLALMLGLSPVVASRVRALCMTKAELLAMHAYEHAYEHPHALRERRDGGARLDTAVLECVQLAPPVLTPSGPATDRSAAIEGGYTVTLMDHVFGNSYGRPFVGTFEPPSTPFNRVVLNLTAVSAGVQFDRLALMYLGDTEVWRTSTAEPTAAPGIRWVYLKDMTQYLSLWKTPQKVIFDLGNLQNDVYTGAFHMTLTATFFQHDDDDATAPSDLVIPISKRQGASGSGSQFTLPSDQAANTISNFPRNARRAVFSVSANGQAGEEFWWQNVLQSNVATFDASVGALPGFSPFREVQVRIDGQLAGVQWPFPVVFTGGVVPGLHRPIVGVDVFDLREHEIDISPWLPLLCDGQPHTFSITVSGLSDDGTSDGSASLTGTVPSSWTVTGKIFVWLDKSTTNKNVTTGGVPVVVDSGAQIRLTQRVGQDASGGNATLHYTVDVTRQLSVTGSVARAGRTRAAAWTQALSYSTTASVLQAGQSQINQVTISGSDRASGASSYSADYTYPISCNTSATTSAEGNLAVWAHLDQGLTRQVSGASVFPTGLEAFSVSVSRDRDRDRSPRSRSFPGGSSLSTRHVATASYFRAGDGQHGYGFGTIRQDLSFGGVSQASMVRAPPDVVLYARQVSSANDSFVADHETVAGVGETTIVTTPATEVYAPAIVPAVPGRGLRLPLQQTLAD